MVDIALPLGTRLRDRDPDHRPAGATGPSRSSTARTRDDGRRRRAPSGPTSRMSAPDVAAASSREPATRACSSRATRARPDEVWDDGATRESSTRSSATLGLRRPRARARRRGPLPLRDGPAAGADVLADVYARALALTGVGRSRCSGTCGARCGPRRATTGALGTHLLEQGDAGGPAARRAPRRRRARSATTAATRRRWATATLSRQGRRRVLPRHASPAARSRSTTTSRTATRRSAGSRRPRRLTPWIELERQIERGIVFTHTVLSEQAGARNENEAMVNGLVDVLVERGLVERRRAASARSRRSARRAPRSSQLATAGVAIRIDARRTRPAADGRLRGAPARLPRGVLPAALRAERRGDRVRHAAAGTSGSRTSTAAAPTATATGSTPTTHALRRSTTSARRSAATTAARTTRASGTTSRRWSSTRSGSMPISAATSSARSRSSWTRSA